MADQERMGYLHGIGELTVSTQPQCGQILALLLTDDSPSTYFNSDSKSFHQATYRLFLLEFGYQVSHMHLKNQLPLRLFCQRIPLNYQKGK